MNARRIGSAVLLGVLCTACWGWSAEAGRRTAAPSAPKITPTRAPLGLTAIGPEGAQQRTVAFSGDPIVVNARVNRGTLLRLPSTPLVVQLGRPEDFSIEVLPELNYVMIKPLVRMGATNVFVTTKSGLYLFFFYADDEPDDFKTQTARKFDMLVNVTDPHGAARLDDVESLVWMAYHGRKMDDLQLKSDLMTTPNTSIYAEDPILGVGVRATLMRAHLFPADGLCTYWIRFENAKASKLNLKSYDQTYALDEKTVRADGLLKVAVPNIGGRSVPLMSPGDMLDMFLVTRADTLPPVLRVRFALQGSRTIPMEASFPTRPSGWKDKKVAKPRKPESPEMKRLRDEVADTGTTSQGQPASQNESGPGKSNDYVIDEGPGGGQSANPTSGYDVVFETPGGSAQEDPRTSGAPRLSNEAPDGNVQVRRRPQN